MDVIAVLQNMLPLCVTKLMNVTVQNRMVLKYTQSRTRLVYMFKNAGT